MGLKKSPYSSNATQPRTLAGMVVNLGSTFIKRIQLAKKMYGITPENDTPHPAGDLRSPHERNIQVGRCSWRGGVFLGHESHELDSAAGQGQGLLFDGNAESGSGCSSNEADSPGLETVRHEPQ